MGEDNVSSSSVSRPCEDNAGSVHEENLFKQDSSVCTVILDSSNVTFIPILPVEPDEEVVMYEGMQEDVKVEIDVCTDGYSQDVYSKVYSQLDNSSAETKPQQKNSRQGVHKCKVCPKTFSQVVNLVTHERIHTGEKPYKCTKCMKPFSQQPNLWKHMRTHTGERPFQCKTCKKRFTQQANLTKHIRVHTGERPYGCQYCGKCFTQQANLTKHVRLHTGERPFHCRFCTKTFVQQSNLERHERTHTGVKPFKCKICCDSFAQNAHLAKHVRTIHRSTTNPFYIKVTSQCKEGPATNIEMGSKPDIVSSNQYAINSSKKLGIPVLYCTKTGRILKRVD